MNTTTLDSLLLNMYKQEESPSLETVNHGDTTERNKPRTENVDEYKSVNR